MATFETIWQALEDDAELVALLGESDFGDEIKPAIFSVDPLPEDVLISAKPVLQIIQAGGTRDGIRKNWRGRQALTVKMISPRSDAGESVGTLETRMAMERAIVVLRSIEVFVSPPSLLRDRDGYAQLVSTGEFTLNLT